MRDLRRAGNPYRDDKAIDSCGLFGMMSLDGRTFSGAEIVRAMANMHDRGNGLGGGYAAYGIYPEYSEYYALHVMFESRAGRDATESCIAATCEVAHDEDMPTRPTAGIGLAPALRRYFVQPRRDDTSAPQTPETCTYLDRERWADERIIELVMRINTEIPDAFVFSSGKNVGVFKGVGYPEDIGRFFRLDEYEGYLWTGHGRFPTNTQGWWGGAHPFSILDWTVVHNGEISSYGTNRAFLETKGYRCALQTDTEVIAYAVDLLVRRHGLPVTAMTKVLAPPFWAQIDRMSEPERALYTTLRVTYPGLLMNGPFTVIIANRHMMLGLRDRVELRPLIAATADDMLYLSSEEAPIRLVTPDLERVWVPKGGEAIIGTVGAGVSGAMEGVRCERNAGAG